MSGHEHHGDCGYDYNNSWDYECYKPRKHRRRHSRKRHQSCWDYTGW
jgi:hypothetical protein